MKVLWVSPVCPYPLSDGNRQRNYYLLRAIAQRHDVTLLYPNASAVHVGEFKALSIKVVTVPDVEGSRGANRAFRRAHLIASRRPPFTPPSLPRMVAALRALDGPPFDVAVGGLSVAEAVLSARAITTVLDNQNVESRLYRLLYHGESTLRRRIARYIDWRAVRHYERSLLPKATAVTACSRADAQELMALAGLPRVQVVPNGVQLRPVGRSARTNSQLIVFVGSMSYTPNERGAMYAAREVMPRVWARLPDARLAIIGGNPPPAVRELAESRVIVTGYVADIGPWMDDAAVALVTVPAGGGTRLKILEAFNYGVSVVTTPGGASGLDLESGTHALIADTPQGLADAVVELIERPQRRLDLSTAARRKLEQDFDWSSIGAEFDALLRELVRARDNP